MTSANVTYYGVYKDGKLIEEISQHAYCKDRVKEKLAQYTPPEDYTLIARWPDENEVDHFTREISLADYVNKTKTLRWKGDEDFIFTVYRTSNIKKREEVDFSSLAEFLSWCEEQEPDDIIVHSGNELEIYDDSRE